MPPIVGGATRKSHTKSRKGCATCKRRHIRCDENKPQCKNCIKHHVRCDFVDAGTSADEANPPPRGPNLLSNAGIERELEAWRTSGIFPFPELHLQYPQQFQCLTRIELRLIHHLCTIYREMRLADFGGCTLWVQDLPSFLDAAHGFKFTMSAILAFSATHMAWITRSAETKNLAYHHQGVALKGLQEAIGQFSEENSDAALAASILLSWQASDWESWKFLRAGISTVISSMSGWKGLSRFANYIEEHSSFFSTSPASVTFDNDSVYLATNSFQELSARLQNVHPVAHHVQAVLEFAHDFPSWSTSLQVEQLFDRLQPLRSWLFWLSVSLVKNNDMSSAAMVLLAQLHTFAISIDDCLPELNGAALGCLTVQATCQIDVKLRSKVAIATPGEMHPAELDNLMHFCRIMSARNHLQDVVSQDSGRATTQRPQSPYSFHRLSLGSQPGTPNYPPPISPALSSIIPTLASPSFDDLSFPPSPFLHYSNAASRRTSQHIEDSPHLSEHSFDNRSLSGLSHHGDSPAYSPAAYSPVFLPDMPDDDWSFGEGSPAFTSAFSTAGLRIDSDSPRLPQSQLGDLEPVATEQHQWLS